jgi:hypothetical protein
MPHIHHSFDKFADIVGSSIATTQKHLVPLCPALRHIDRFQTLNEAAFRLPIVSIRLPIAPVFTAIATLHGVSA